MGRPRTPSGPPPGLFPRDMAPPPKGAPKCQADHAPRQGYCQRYPELFRAAGLVDVEERHFVWPTNGWVRGRHLKKLARWLRRDLGDGLEGLSLRLLTGVGGMAREEIQGLLEGVRRDLEDTTLRCYMPV